MIGSNPTLFHTIFKSKCHFVSIGIYFTFVSCDRLEQMQRNVRASANHGLEFVSGEKRKKWNRNDPGHSFPDASHGRIEFVKPKLHRQFDVFRSVFGGDTRISGKKNKHNESALFKIVSQISKCRLTLHNQDAEFKQPTNNFKLCSTTLEKVLFFSIQSKK